MVYAVGARRASIILLAALLLATTGIVAGAWGVNHPDQCVACHGDGNPLTTDEASGQNAWDHVVVTGDPAWQACTTCHTTIGSNVGASVHAALTCKGCHAVAHVGVYDGTIYTAGIFTYEVDTGGDRLLSPDAVTLQRKALLLTEANASTYYPGIADLLTQATNGMEVEVGGWDSLNNQFVDVTPLGLTDTAYRICFSCHFLAQNPAEVGAYRIVDGKWMIGITPDALEMDPHSLVPLHDMDTQLEASDTGGNTGLLIAGIALAAAAIAAKTTL